MPGKGEVVKMDYFMTLEWRDKYTGSPSAADGFPAAINLTFLILGLSIGGICPLQASFVYQDC
jgi:hypothetical protein